MNYDSLTFFFSFLYIFIIGFIFLARFRICLLHTVLGAISMIGVTLLEYINMENNTQNFR